MISLIILLVYIVVSLLLIWIGWALGGRLPFTGAKKWAARFLMPVILLIPVYQEFFILPQIYKYMCHDIDLSDVVKERQSVTMLYIGDDDGSCGENCRNGLFKYNLPAVVGADIRWKSGEKVIDRRWKFEAVSCQNPADSQCVQKTDVTGLAAEDAHWYVDHIDDPLSDTGDFFQSSVEMHVNRHTGQVLRAQKKVEFEYPALSNFIIRLQYRKAYRRCSSRLYSTYPEANHWSHL